MCASDFEVLLRLADAKDAALVAHIYNHYVGTSTVTFEEVVVDSEEMARRIEGVRSQGLPWYVAIEGDQLLGYAYATPWRSRAAYRYAAEVTVYVAEGKSGEGLGTRLETAVLDVLRDRGFHTALAGIALPNPASIALHERLGFKKVAHFAQVGFKMGCWIDVGYWQRIMV